MPDGSTIQGKNVYVTSAGFATHTAGTGRLLGYISPHGNGTAVLSTVVPADGAELVSATFTVISIGVGGGTQQWSIADTAGTVLATRAALIDTTAAGTISTLTTATSVNGKAIAATAGARLTLTNTSVGTSTQGSTGIFNLVWAL